LSGTLNFPASRRWSKITVIKVRASESVRPVAWSNSPSLSSLPASSSPSTCSFARAVGGCEKPLVAIILQARLQERGVEVGGEIVLRDSAEGRGKGCRRLDRKGTKSAIEQVARNDVKLELESVWRALGVKR